MDIRRIQAKAAKKCKEAQAKIEAAKEAAAKIRAKQVNRVIFEDEIDGIKVINIEAWLAGVYPRRDVLSSIRPSDYDRRLFDWCQNNKAHYYARRFDGFILSEGIREAVALRRKVLVYEKLG